MFPLQMIDAIADALERIMGNTHDIQTEPLDMASTDKTISVFPVSWVPEQDTVLMGNGVPEPTINHYLIKVQNLTIHGDVRQAYTQFTTDQRKIRAILYRDATLRVALGGMSEAYLGSTERFKRMHVVRQTSLPGRRTLAMYFLSETDIQIDTETSDT